MFSGERVVRGVDGRMWRVREVGAESPDGRGRSLIFDAESIVRRVVNYPDDWESCSDAQLLALMDRGGSTQHFRDDHPGRTSPAG